RHNDDGADLYGVVPPRAHGDAVHPPDAGRGRSWTLKPDNIVLHPVTGPRFAQVADWQTRDGDRYPEWSDALLVSAHGQVKDAPHAGVDLLCLLTSGGKCLGQYPAPGKCVAVGRQPSVLH